MRSRRCVLWWAIEGSEILEGPVVRGCTFEGLFPLYILFLPLRVGSDSHSHYWLQSLYQKSVSLELEC